jgi:alkylhydroperoxidase family enzyme
VKIEMNDSRRDKTTGPERAAWHVADAARRGSFISKRPRRHRAFVTIARRATRGRSWRVFEALSYGGRLMRPFLMLNVRMMPFGKLPRRDTELLILRTAWLCGSRYEYAQHTPFGRQFGLTDREFAATREGPDTDGLTARDQALLAACDELVADHVIADATWERLRPELSDNQMVELCLLVGLYAALAGTLNSTAVQLEQPMEKWVKDL